MIYFVIAFGAIVGSFLNVCIFRIPEKQSIVVPSSFCPHCRSKIRFYDNIPVLSFILLFGRCRRCGRRISFVYPIVELLTALVALLVYSKHGITPIAFIMFYFISALIVVSFIDIKHFIIPDSISISGIVLGFIFSFVPGNEVAPLESLFGLLLGGVGLLLVGLLYEKLTGKEGIGGGDIKLLAMIGAFLGYKAVVLTLFISSVFGALVGTALLLMFKNRDRDSLIPYGPFLSLAAVISIFYGEQIITAYLNMFYV